MCRTAAAGLRSRGFGLGDQWRFSVDSEIHPPNLDEVPTRKRASKSADLEASLDLNPRFLRRAVCFARTGVSGRSVSVRRNSCVAVREDLLKASSQYVNYIGKPFKLTVRYTPRVAVYPPLAPLRARLLCQTHWSLVLRWMIRLRHPGSDSSCQ